MRLVKIRHNGLPFISTDAGRLVLYGQVYCYVLLT